MVLLQEFNDMNAVFLLLFRFWSWASMAWFPKEIQCNSSLCEMSAHLMLQSDEYGGEFNSLPSRLHLLLQRF